MIDEAMGFWEPEVPVEPFAYSSVVNAIFVGYPISFKFLAISINSLSWKLTVQQNLFIFIRVQDSKVISILIF